MRWIGWLLLLLAACSAQRVQEQNNASLAEIREVETARTAQLASLAGRGAIELRWRDDDGNHREQGDLDFWRDGLSLSFRISKLGEPLYWFGGDEQHHWFFDMTGDETVLHIDMDDPYLDDIVSDTRDGLVLLGLAPLPKGTESGVNPMSTLDARGRTWQVTWREGRLASVTLIDGDHHLIATHRRSIQVEIPNSLSLNWPVTSGLIDISRNDREGEEIKIAFGRLSTDTSEEPMDRVFDLAFLRSALRPATVRGPSP